MTLPGSAHLAKLSSRSVDAASVVARSTARRLGDWPENAVDDWGRDPDLAARAAKLAGVRWDVAVTGHERLPARGGALIVVNARRFALTPIMAALAIGDAIDRPVRFVGRPDVAPIGPLLQRVGGLLAHPAEIEAALTAGELVLVGAADRDVLAAALAARVRVFPAAANSSPFSRRATVVLGAPAHAARIRRGPLAEVELGQAVAARIDQLQETIG